MADILKIYTIYRSCLLWILVLTSSFRYGRTLLKMSEDVCEMFFVVYQCFFLFLKDMGSHAIVKGIVLMTISMAHVKLDLSASALLQLKKCTILTQVCQNLNTPMAVCHLKKRVSCKYALISSFIDEFQLQEDIFFYSARVTLFLT